MTDAIEAVKKRIKKKKKFYNHLGTYVVVCVFLLGLNLYTDPSNIWAVWPICGWGLAVAMDAVSVLVDDKTSRWEQKAIKQELEQMGYDPDSYADDGLQLDDLPGSVREKEILYKKSDLV